MLTKFQKICFDLRCVFLHNIELIRQSFGLKVPILFFLYLSQAFFQEQEHAGGPALNSNYLFVNNYVFLTRSF
jgi:hypothetical protein